MLNKQFLNQFLSTLDNINGLYLDAKAGFRSVHNILKEKQRLEVDKGQYSLKDLGQAPFVYIQSKENNRPKHRTSVNKVMERNKANGQNEKQMANLCIVLIYHYWEYYRGKTEKLNSTNIFSNLMADIKYYRNSIIHHNGFANEEVKKCKVLTWFKYKDEIMIDEYKFQKIIEAIKKEIQDNKIKTTSPNTGLPIRKLK